MASYSSYTNYFRFLAQVHADILHTTDNNSFYTVDITELLSGLRSSIRKDGYIMLFMNYSKDYLTESRAETKITFFILHKETNGGFEENNGFRDEAELIANDIIARVVEDSRSHTEAMNKLWYGSMDDPAGTSVIQTEIRAGAETWIGVQVSFDTKSKSTPCVRNGKFLG